MFASFRGLRCVSFAAEELLGDGVGRHDDADEHDARQEQAGEVVHHPAGEAVAVLELARVERAAHERAVHEDRQIQGRALEHQRRVLFEVVDAPLAGLLLGDESDRQRVERGEHVYLHEAQEDDDGDDDGRALGDEERDEQQDQARYLAHPAGGVYGVAHAVAKAEARRRAGGGCRRMDAAEHAVADLVDGLEHELAVLGRGEHERELEHRHGDELDAQLSVAVRPGADPGEFQDAHDRQYRAGYGFDRRAGDGQAQLVHARVVFGGGLQQVGHEVVADAGPYRVEDTDDEIDHAWPPVYRAMLENRAAAAMIRPPPTTCQTPDWVAGPFWSFSPPARVMTPHTAHRPPPMMANWLKSCNALVTTLPLSAAMVIPYMMFSFRCFG